MIALIVAISNDVNAKWLFPNVITGSCWHDSWFLIVYLIFVSLGVKEKQRDENKKKETRVVIQFYANWKVYSEELLDAISVSKDFVDRLDQLQIAKSDGLDKNFTRGFKRSRTRFGEKQLPSGERTEYIFFKANEMWGDCVTRSSMRMKWLHFQLEQANHL